MHDLPCFTLRTSFQKSTALFLQALLAYLSACNASLSRLHFFNAFLKLRLEMHTSSNRYCQTLHCLLASISGNILCMCQLNSGIPTWQFSTLCNTLTTTVDKTWHNIVKSFENTINIICIAITNTFLSRIYYISNHIIKTHRAIV